MTAWRTQPYHRDWLMAEANKLFDFYQYASVNPAGGFFELDSEGRPSGGLNMLPITCRMVHCMAIGHLLGRPGCGALIDHGMSYIWNSHRDAKWGGYLWSLNEAGAVDATKQAYGHAFVLLAASSAKMAGHPLADRMLADVTGVLNEKFWEERHGAQAEEFARDWSHMSDYRGQNSNMHLTEALMAAFEATGDGEYLRKAGRIAELIIGRHAAGLGYRVAEHFDANWALDKAYKGSDMFRPAGTTPGHWLEWSRLLLQLWELSGRKTAWLPEAADRLFRAAVDLGWDATRGGFYYTLDWENRPALTHKIWWPVTEAIGAAAYLAAHRPDPFYEDWYRRLWGFAANHLLDHRHGGWHPELDDSLRSVSIFFSGKPDIYHALQACLIPLYPATASLTRVISEARG